MHWLPGERRDWRAVTPARYLTFRHRFKSTGACNAPLDIISCFFPRPEFDIVGPALSLEPESQLFGVRIRNWFRLELSERGDQSNCIWNLFNGLTVLRLDILCCHTQLLCIPFASLGSWTKCISEHQCTRVRGGH